MGENIEHINVLFFLIVIRDYISHSLRMAIPTDVDFEGFHHAVAVYIGDSRGECQAKFVVAAKRWAFFEVNFVSDVGWNVHTWIAGVCCDVDVGFFALENGCVWDFSAIEVDAQGVFFMQIVDAKSQATS